MENKLDNLTQKIYQEGIEKANLEGEKIISNARAEAERIVRQAKEEAEHLKKTSEKEAEEIKRNTMASVKLAGTQAISSLKQQIKDLLSLKILDQPSKELFVDSAFLKELILTLSKNWDTKEGVTLSFSSAMKEKMDKTFEASIKKEIVNLQIVFENKPGMGFTITPQNGAFQITFSDQDFIAFFKPFVREKAEKILFE